MALFRKLWRKHKKVIDAVNKRFSLNITTKEYDIGGIVIDNHGTMATTLDVSKLMRFYSACGGA